ncbi:MAG TPA: ABC transporter substrate-binding protein [Verrucomicrobiae bacterium]|jgi:putative ABC transport system substrate-binding protein|nr:ABC transporter substrate-binding protein [Verrucomicrobiae bacterium]
MTTRRELLAVAGMGTLLALPVPGLAQPLRRVGVLVPAPRAGYEQRLAALRGGLRDLGYVEGKSVAYEYRESEGRYELLPSLAAELVNRKVHVIVTAGTPAALAAKKATTTIPIVIGSISDPVATGVVPSLARPAGNITGLMFSVAELCAKRLELIKQAIPRMKRAAMLMNPDNASMEPAQREMAQAGKTLGVEVMRFDVRAEAELEDVLQAMVARRADAVVMVEDAFLNVNAGRLGALATAKHLPSIGLDAVAQGGGLLAYGVNQLDMFQRAATYIDKIFKGARPADLPIQRSSTFDLILNLKTARQLGVPVPPELRLRANQVLE